MKNDISQKLDSFDQYLLSDMQDVPDTLDERCKALRISAPPAKAKPRRAVRVALAALAAAVCAAAVALPIYYSGTSEIAAYPPDQSQQPAGPTGPGGDDGPGVSTDPGDIKEVDADWSALICSRALVHPNSGYDSAYARLASKDGADVYAILTYMYGSDKLEIYAVFDENYEVPGRSTYQSAAQTSSFGDITYKYNVLDRLHYAHAYFTCAGIEYYVSYYSRSPENITVLMSTLCR